jgi:DEAD/DEAH box helicase domain-containing protein
MDIGEFLEDIRQAPGYRDQIVYVREYAAREAQYADPEQPLTRQTREALAAQGVGRLYTHQAEAVDRARAGEDLLVVTGTASGKSLCYQIPIIETLLADPSGPSARRWTPPEWTGSSRGSTTATRPGTCAADCARADR